MNCNYPQCHRLAAWTPVVILPMTIRTPGVIKPILSPFASDRVALLKRGFNQNRLIQQYERAMDDYKRTHSNITARDEPCYLLGKEVCGPHKDTYNFFNWFRRSEWEYLREAARFHGYDLPEGRLLKIEFRPVGWTPKDARIELQRDRMAKEA